MERPHSAETQIVPAIETTQLPARQGIEKSRGWFRTLAIAAVTGWIARDQLEQPRPTGPQPVQPVQHRAQVLAPVVPVEKIQVSVPMEDEEEEEPLIEQNEQGHEEELPLTGKDFVEAVRRVQSSVFYIKGRNSYGTAFHIGDGKLLTNWHVLHDNAHFAEWRNPPLVSPFPLRFPLPPFVQIKKFIPHQYDVESFTADPRKPGKQFRVTHALDADGNHIDYKDVSLLQMPPDVYKEMENSMDVFPVAEPEAGRDVMAIGNPYDCKHSASFGRISTSLALDRHNEARRKQMPYFGFDAAINQGNSGGPVYTLEKTRKGLKVSLAGVSNWKFMIGDGTGHAIRADYLAYLVTQWGIPLYTEQQCAAYRTRFPEFAQEIDDAVECGDNGR